MVTIKVTETLHEQLHKLVSDVHENGWQHLGVSRKDKPTMSSLIAEALGRLKKR
jgi:hypothetical protein